MGELLKQVTCENSLNGIKLLTISHEQDEILEDIIPSSVNSAALADILNKLPKSLLAVDGFMPTLYPVADNGIIGSRSINAMLDQLSYQPIIVNADFVSLQGYSKYEAELKEYKLINTLFALGIGGGIGASTFRKNMTRREFLKFSGKTAIGLALAASSIKLYINHMSLDYAQRINNCDFPTDYDDLKGKPGDTNERTFLVTKKFSAIKEESLIERNIDPSMSRLGIFGTAHFKNLKFLKNWDYGIADELLTRESDFLKANGSSRPDSLRILFKLYLGMSSVVLTQIVRKNKGDYRLEVLRNSEGDYFIFDPNLVPTELHKEGLWKAFIWQKCTNLYDNKQ